jgi:hypothetical protein
MGPCAPFPPLIGPLGTLPERLQDRAKSAIFAILGAGLGPPGDIPRLEKSSGNPHASRPREVLAIRLVVGQAPVSDAVRQFQPRSMHTTTRVPVDFLYLIGNFAGANTGHGHGFAFVTASMRFTNAWTPSRTSFGCASASRRSRTPASGTALRRSLTLSTVPSHHAR